MEWKTGGMITAVTGTRAARPPGPAVPAPAPAQRRQLEAIRRELEVQQARTRADDRRAGVDPGEWRYRELPAAEVAPAVAARARAEVTRAADELHLGYVGLVFFVPEDEVDVEDWYAAKARTGRAPWQRFTDRAIGGKADAAERSGVVWLRPLTDPAALRHLARHEVRHLQQHRQLGPIDGAADPEAERAWREADAEEYARRGDDTQWP